MKKEAQRYFILMADIINSSKYEGNELMAGFKEVVQQVNKQKSPSLLSPITITLGDEFQCIVTNLSAGLEVILEIEETIIQKEKDFKLRYVLNYGTIDTPINEEVAHEMLGEGLTQARQLLEQVKEVRQDRFFVQSGDRKKDEILDNLFVLYQAIVDSWKPQDYRLVSAFLELKDYKLVAEKMEKVRSLMWKREKSLQIKEYIAARDLLHLIVS